MILRNGQTELSWIVDLKIYHGNYYYIGRGWPAFYFENGLKQGDRFKLEFVQTEIYSMANFYRKILSSYISYSLKTKSYLTFKVKHSVFRFQKLTFFLY